MRIQDWQGEFGNRNWWLRALGLAVASGIILGVAGPFGSFFNGDIVLRVFSWTVNLTVGTLIVGTLIPFVTRLCIRLKIGRLTGLIIGLLIATVPVALFSAVFGYWLWPRAVSRVKIEDWYSQALLVETVMLGLWVLIALALQAPRSVPAATNATGPIDLHEPVLCLQMEDHYVRIHRASGSKLELMPMHEAILRYGQAGGLRVHRSWWVAASAVDAAERDVRNWRLRLSNGQAVPIARNRIAEVRACGWIGDDS